MMQRASTQRYRISNFLAQVTASWIERGNSPYGIPSMCLRMFCWVVLRKPTSPQQYETAAYLSISSGLLICKRRLDSSPSTEISITLVGRGAFARCEQVLWYSKQSSIHSLESSNILSPEAGSGGRSAICFAAGLSGSNQFDHHHKDHFLSHNSRQTWLSHKFKKQSLLIAGRGFHWP
jgi:hypothetical protein